MAEIEPPELITADESKSQIYKVQPFRKRRVLACVTCHENKRKCDRVKPACSNCERSQFDCRYFENKPIHPRRPRRSTLSPDKDQKQDGANTPKAISNDPKDNNSSVQEKNNNSSLTKLPAAEFEKGTLGKLRSFQEAFWPFLHSQDVTSKSATYNFADSEYKRPNSTFINVLSTPHSHSAIPPDPDCEVLLNYIPDRVSAVRLVERYLWSVHPLLPIFDFMGFYPIYESFWQNQSKADLPFFITFFSILYASSVSAYEEAHLTGASSETIAQLKSQTQKFVGGAEVALAMFHFPRKPTLVGLQSAVLLHSVCRSDCRTDDSAGIAMLVRIAQLMGLNRDPQNYHKMDDKEMIQIRRLLWWQIVHLDGLTSLSNGLPTLVSVKEYDTQMPSEYQELSHDGDLHMLHSVVFANCKFKWIQLSSDIIRLLSDLNQPSQAQIENMKARINDFAVSTKSCLFRILDPKAGSVAVRDFAGFAASVIATFPDRVRILFYEKLNEYRKRGSQLPRDTGLPSPLSETSVAGSSSVADPSPNEQFDKTVVDSAIRFLNEFCVYGKMPENVAYAWEIQKFQPLHSILILLRSLIADARQACHDQTGKLAVELSSENQRAVTVETSIRVLGYLGQHTTKVCIARWKTVHELKDTVWNQLDDIRRYWTAASPSLKSINASSPRDLTCSPIPSPPLGQEAQVDFPPKSGDSTLDFRGTPQIDWDRLQFDLESLDNLIEGHISLKQWDPAAGHYVM